MPEPPPAPMLGRGWRELGLESTRTVSSIDTSQLGGVGICMTQGGPFLLSGPNALHTPPQGRTVSVSRDVHVCSSLNMCACLCLVLVV